MCGFAGYIAFKKERRPDIRTMTAALLHRGPDHAGFVLLDGAALGATRLKIVGETDGYQPDVSRESRTVFAMNGEIYDWRAIADREGIATDSDTRTAHGLLARHGGAALSRLRGAFALALMSANGRRVVLARDQFGQRPLYYAVKDGGVVFGSEIRSIMAAGVSARVDRESLADYLHWHFYLPSKTLFDGVTSVNPGEAVTIEVDDDGTIALYSTHFEWSGPRRSVRDAFDEAVALQGRTGSKSAIFLSGGLDSTVVASGLAKAGPAPDRAIVGAFHDDITGDERPYARAVATRLSIPLDEILIGPDDFRDAFAATIRALEEPIAGPGAVSTYILARAASRSARVVFGGQGGDELFGGYERLRILAQIESGDVPDVPEGYRALFERMAAAKVAQPHDLGAAHRAAIHRARGLDGVISREFDRRAAEDRLAEHYGEESSALESAADFERRIVLPGLLHVDDRAVAAFGMENRAPLLDPAVAAAAALLPWSERIAGGESRPSFRRIFGDLLPPAIAARRDKMGFPVPLTKWWRGPLREFVIDNLTSSTARARGIWDVAAIPGLVESDGHGGRAVFGLLSLEHWFSEFIDTGGRVRFAAETAQLSKVIERSAP